MKYLAFVLLTAIVAGPGVYLFLLSPPSIEAGPPPTDCSEEDLARLGRQALDCAVLIGGESGSYWGAGTLIRVDGDVYVLTAEHVVPEDSIYHCTLRTGAWFTAERVHGSLEHDMALLRPRFIPDGLLLSRTAHITLGRPRPGEPVWYCGYGSSVPFNLDRGIVSRVHPDTVAVTGNAWFGHSGSGVFVRRGGNYYLVGVMSCLASDEEGYGYLRTPVLAERLIGDYLECYGEDAQ